MMPPPISNDQIGDVFQESTSDCTNHRIFVLYNWTSVYFCEDSGYE